MKARKSDLNAALASIDYLQGNDRDFFLRAWATDAEVYRQRIRAIGFELAGRVLDAGCGFGQWTFPLSELNHHVTALDASELRIRVVSDLARRLEIANVSTIVSAIERTPFDAEEFDAVFSYSVIYLTDFRKSIAEFARILRPGGRLYICTNGLGWYLHNLLSGHNATETFNPGQMAVQTFENSLNYYASGRHVAGRQIIIPSSVLREGLEGADFKIEGLAPEGELVVRSAEAGKSFYKSSYFGAEGVYEVMAQKVV